MIKNGEYLLAPQEPSSTASPAGTDGPSKSSIVATILHQRLADPKYTRQVWYMLLEIAKTSCAYLDSSFVFAEAIKALENNTFPAEGDANAVLWGVVRCLLSAMNFKPVLPLLHLPRYEQYQREILPALARTANVDVGDG